ncbi:MULTISPECIES: adenylate kinase [unclassified Streptomyces]|uniref:adenylate kinase n=1 Tax=unclassified Streptomyces TaxID=2593676 RepID=UPI00224DCD3E|nr:MULTISPECIES: adenylate kinase [unclassified Streptomyces]MCX5054135.1 adenylate kinase [Streptomyces sp. NBC_00474]MCX5063151.1 adenylate kinase [Streptomyces sp. NBC_00452]MCX5250991.1 adenylate kinase [Streptomyces sp. NBC_00201]MCX5291080.1 adenylate kinase [Streptomyces sp. NBC_00183]
MQRILVVGVTGAGKSTLAQAVSARLDMPYHEMDALYFTGPDWAVNDKLTETVSPLAAEPRWIIDSIGYPEVRDLLWERADTVLWLDYAKRVVLPRVLRRSLRRTLTREPVFGGNTETWAGWLSKEHPVWWAWSQHAGRRREIAHRTSDPRFAPLRTLRFTRPADTAAWLATLTPVAAAPGSDTAP